MTHILDNFENALKELYESVLTMGSMAQRNLEAAVNGFIKRDSGLCNQAIGDDDEVNQLEMDIDRLGMEIMLRYQPVASDLRKVLAAIKISGNLERISDEAESIARRGKKMNKHPELRAAQMLEPIYEQAMSQLDKAMPSYAEVDIQVGIEVGKEDELLDRNHRKLIKDMTAAMVENTDAIKDYLHLIFIARCLERVGDHAVNIGEEAVFIGSAQDIRHGNVDLLDAEEE